MQLIIEHDVKGPLVLPINYLHILQSAVYASLADDREYASQLHDMQNQSMQRSFKFFQFSMIQGKFEIKDKNIIFRNHILFEIRSISPDFINRVKCGIENNGITYQEHHFDDVKVQVRDDRICKSDVVIQMKTPICVYRTNRETKKTYYPDVNEPLFRQLVIDNFIRKYKAYTGEAPEEELSFELLKAESRDHFVTKYKEFYISGWKGEYRLKGKPEYLDFLYQVGLGGKNSQGFGMFVVL